MPRSARLAAGALLLLALPGSAALKAAEAIPALPAAPTLALTPADRLLVLAPHPDDEVLGCGGLLQQAVALKIPVEVAFLTYGDSNEWSFLTWRLHPVVTPVGVERMGEVRRQEALDAERILGVPADRLTFLGYPDHGTLDLWTSHWGPRPPGHGPLTRARAVPYPDAFRPGAPYKGEEVLSDLEALLVRFRPTQVCVSHPADHHPDHAALYLFTKVALWNLAGRVETALHPYLVHDPGWPARGYRPGAPQEAPATLESAVLWRSWPLTPAEVATKRRALAAHRSQWRSGERHLLPFARATEITGDFPPFDLPAGRTEAVAWTGGEPLGAEPPRLARAGDRLEVAFPVGPRLPVGFRLNLYAFGYRRDRPFAASPKIEVRMAGARYEVLDQGETVPPGGAGGAVTVERRAGRLVIGLPLVLLGDPERLFLAARTATERVTLTRLPWRVVELR
jgi:LmbE family N-acetylglucosaminyl deacetylase